MRVLGSVSALWAPLQRFLSDVLSDLVEASARGLSPDYRATPRSHFTSASTWSWGMVRPALASASPRATAARHTGDRARRPDCSRPATDRAAREPCLRRHRLPDSITFVS